MVSISPLDFLQKYTIGSSIFRGLTPPDSNIIFSTFNYISQIPLTKRPPIRCGFGFSDLPKQFRAENLKDGLMENYKDASQSLYGLSASEMQMFMRENSPVNRQSKGLSEEKISASWNYSNHHGSMKSLGSLATMGGSSLGMGETLVHAGTGGPIDPDDPPDLPSMLLHSRICYLGMPIVPEVTELILAQFLWLDFDDATKPIYLYINSSGTQDDKMESVGSETDAFAIADSMSYCKSDVYTVNCGMAYGQAAMILSLGVKGYRALLPHSSTKLYMPKVGGSSGASTDMWIKSKELNSNTEYYIELLGKGTGRTKEEITEDIERPKYFAAQEAIDYGLADRIITKEDTEF